MHRFQKILLLGTALIASPLTYQTVKEFLTYFSLTERAFAQILQWEVEEVSDRFALRGIYTFSYQGNTWKGTSLLPPPYFLNEPAAISALKERAKQSSTAWYNPNNPSLSSLTHIFPTSLFLRTVTCYAVLFYFLLVRIRL